MSARAVEFRGDGAAHLVERRFTDPGPRDLLIAPRAVGICATDREVCDGSMAYFRLGMARYPVIPGHEWSGEVVAVGGEVEDFAPGDLVVGECSVADMTCDRCRRGLYHLCPNRTETGIMNRDGGMAELLVFPARSAFKVPAHLDAEAAALVEPSAVAVNVTRAAEVGPGDRVLVVGGGPIGLLALQAAGAAGAVRRVVAERSPVRLEQAANLGADAGVLVEPGLDVARDPELCDDQIDVVIEATGHPSGLAFALQSARPGGRIGVVSLYGRAEVEVDLDLVVTRDITIRGALGSPHAWPRTLELIGSGAIRTAPLITSRYGLDEVPGALEQLERGGESEVKVVVKPTSGG